VRLSKKRYHHYIASGESPDAGISLISGYIFNDAPHKETPLWTELAYNFRQLDEEELSGYPGLTARYGWFYTTLLVECRQYLPHLTKKFMDFGGHIRKSKVDNLCQGWSF